VLPVVSKRAAAVSLRNQVCCTWCIEPRLEVIGVHSYSKELEKYISIVLFRIGVQFMF